MKKLSEWLTNCFLRHEIITAEQAEWCVYTLHKKLFTAVVFGWLLLLGTWAGGLWPALLFTCCFLFLRKRTNGYHAHTQLGCVAVSTVIEVLAMWMLPRFVFEVYTVILAGSFICVLLLSPVNNKQIHLTEKELRAMRWRGHLRAFMLLAFSLFLWYLGFFDLAVSAALAIFFTSASLVLAILGFGIQ